MKEFIHQWKQYSFKIALDNLLIGVLKKFIGAKRIRIAYNDTGRINNHVKDTLNENLSPSKS